MASWDNTNTIVVFKNKKKKEGSNAADYNGKLNIDGLEYTLGLWIKVDKNGNPFMSGRVTRDTGDWRGKRKEDNNAGNKPEEKKDDTPF